MSDEWLRDLMRVRFGEQMRYIVVGKERHKDGAPHLHAYIQFVTSLDAKKDTFDISLENEEFHANIKTVRGRADKAIAYVKKEGRWCDYGESPLKAAKERREEKVRYALTHTIEEAAESGKFSLFELNAMTRLQKEMKEREQVWPPFKKRKVFWYYGSTGTGKTRVGMRKIRQCKRWVKLDGCLRQFINGYNGEEGVLIDDMRAGTIDFNTLLALLDGYPTRVNVKGGHREWMAEVIVITAPKRPEEVFYDHVKEQPWDRIEQLTRRIDEFRDFDQKGFGEDPDDVETVVLQPMEQQAKHGYLAPAPELIPESPQEAVLFEESEISAIPGSLNEEVEIINGVVHPLFGEMPKFK